MTKYFARDENGNPDIGVFQNNGLIYGSLLGVVVGLVIAGPHFSEWSLVTIGLTVAASALAIGLLGIGAVFFAVDEEKMRYHVVRDHPAPPAGGDGEE